MAGRNSGVLGGRKEGRTNKGWIGASIHVDCLTFGKRARSGGGGGGRIERNAGARRVLVNATADGTRRASRYLIETFPNTRALGPRPPHPLSRQLRLPRRCDRNVRIHHVSIL